MVIGEINLSCRRLIYSAINTRFVAISMPKSVEKCLRGKVCVDLFVFKHAFLVMPDFLVLIYPGAMKAAQGNGITQKGVFI